MSKRPLASILPFSSLHRRIFSKTMSWPTALVVIHKLVAGSYACWHGGAAHYIYLPAGTDELFVCRAFFSLFPSARDVTC